MNKVNSLRHQLLNIKSTRPTVKLFQGLSYNNFDLAFFVHALKTIGEG